MSIVKVIVEYAGNNLSAYIPNAPIITTGKNLAEIRTNISEAISLYLEDNPSPLEMLVGDYQIELQLDAATFINCYSGIFTKSALSRITGINERQIWHYAAGMHKPRKQQVKKIQNGIEQISKELAEINICCK
ncbi:MAG: type II toxin-antitoxin system HicB family antitoxin [Bacteroidales bacterium]|nr:type II toxin-antitoxin system HicB family antitoxin [Bacteroidales bacterium]MCQ2960400.1 type II toxin-antitoxin system HicB family antitoxin [Bacteroidales bacterium]